MQTNSLSARPLRILVTGAAGLIGRSVCRALRARGHAVTGLLHRGGSGWADGAAIEGDVAEPGLGLPPDTAKRLQAELDGVVHCAAVTAFNLPDETYSRVNTCGTAQVLAFTGGPRPIPLLHVSTAYVCGAADGVVPEAPLRPAGFNNGYEASKAAAEGLVLAADRAVAVARPTIVVGRWADGAADAFGPIYQLIRLLTEGRIGALPVLPGASLDLVPVDHVAEGIADIAERMTQAAGRIFHLASGTPVPLTALLRLAGAFPQLQRPRFVAPGGIDLSSLDVRERWLHRHVVQAFAPYLRPSPLFTASNLLALSGRRCPAIDDEFLRHLLGFAVAAGFLPGGQVSGYRDKAGRAAAAFRPPNSC